jgi:hypothetical protein
MARIVRLTERDLSRIVRRVLKEEEDTTSMVGGCFSKTTLSIPKSCDTKPKKTLSGTMGTGDLISKECLNAIGNMLTYNNLKEVTKVLNCLLIKSPVPLTPLEPLVSLLASKSKDKTPKLSDEDKNKLYNKKIVYPNPKYLSGENH